MNVLVWHVHGSWTTAFVHGPHRYLLPTLPERGPWGGGRPAAWNWPASAVETSRRLVDVDVVVLQRPEEIDLAAGSTGVGARPCRPSSSTPPPRAGGRSRHPMTDRDDLLLVHVTHFNDLMWDAGSTATTVVEHGIVDPGHRYTGELAAAAVCVNEPVRRGRVTGTDLLPRFARAAPLDVFGMGTDGLGAHLGCADVGPSVTCCTCTISWPAAGLPASDAVDLAGALLLEAMHLGAGGRPRDDGGHESGTAGPGSARPTSTGSSGSCARWSPSRTGPGPSGKPVARTSCTGTASTGSSPAGTPSWTGSSRCTIAAARDSPSRPDHASRR